MKYENLTDREREVYKFIVRYLVKHEYSPKLREIGKEFSISSKGVVHRYLKGLERKGFITIVPNRSRGIRLTNLQL